MKAIAELSRQALVSKACSLVLVDMEGKYLTMAGCSGFDLEFENHLIGRKVALGKLKDKVYLDFDLVARGEIVEKTDLEFNGQGVANSRIARKYKLKSILSFPLRSQERVIGYLNHFWSTSQPFTEEKKKLLEIFSAQAVLAIERFEHQETFDLSLNILNALSQSLLSVSPKDVLQQVAEKACELLSVPICIVWELDKTARTLKIVASSGIVDEEYRQIELSLDRPEIQDFLSNKKVAYLLDVTRNRMYGHTAEAHARGWKSIMSAPMHAGNDLIGLLDVYTNVTRYFKQWERQLFGAFANQAALSIQKTDLLEERYNLRERQRQEHRHRIVADIQKAVNRVASIKQVPFEGESEVTLNMIVDQCTTAMRARTCFLRLWNGVTDNLELKAYRADLNPRPRISLRHTVRIGEGISGYVAEAGKTYLSEDVNEDDRHVGLCKSLGLRSVLCVPIKSGELVIGTISVGHDQSKAFGNDQKQLLEEMVESVSHAIERAHLMDCLMRFDEATSRSDSLQSLLDQLVALTRDLMREPVCLVWLFDKNTNGFKVEAFAVPEEQQARIKDLFISQTTSGLDKFLRKSKPLYFPDTSEVATHPYLKMVKQLNWKSMLAMRLAYKGQPFGILEVYSHKKKRAFNSWHKRQFKVLASNASLALETLTSRRQTKRLTEIYEEITASRREDELVELCLKRSLELVGSDRGWISRLDSRTGQLTTAIASDSSSSSFRLRPKIRFSGLVMSKEKPIRVGVRQPDSSGFYDPFWPDTQSELIVPMLISNAEVRVGADVEHVSKSVGVINIESAAQNAFSQADEDVLYSLARQTATIIEKLDFDQKLAKLRHIAKEILNKRGSDETIRIVLRAITETLGFNYVHMTLVQPELNRIKTEYVIGIPDKEVAEFKRLGVCSLDSDDIKAEILKSKRIEVPDVDDKRFDAQIYKRFRQDHLIRVFIPMIVSAGNRPIGTIEAGYNRERKYIYERDVQILVGFVDYIVQALEQRRRGLLEKINHEFTSPVVGIRSNASYLRRHIKEMSEELICHKLDDISTDCQILQYQLGNLEYILGRSPQIRKRELTEVYRDIIIKTLSQLKPLVAERGFDVSRLEYRHEDVHRVKLWVDKARLNQVVYNILVNSIKYAEKEPGSFCIRITADETPQNFILKFKDWGIGIERAYEEKIFDEGFRAPGAIEKHVSGSGLGLTIARETMKKLGGDLRLVNNKKPTEFHLILPKGSREVEDDLIR
jgi:GAF domain-containing protein/anti-sigma regulatory factor (Ser/Thr protein kinase)